MTAQVYISGDHRTGYIVWYKATCLGNAQFVGSYLEWSEARIAEHACRNLLECQDKMAGITNDDNQ